MAAGIEKLGKPNIVERCPESGTFAEINCNLPHENLTSK
jgi:hypothetical protein